MVEQRVIRKKKKCIHCGSTYTVEETQDSCENCGSFDIAETTKYAKYGYGYSSSICRECGCGWKNHGDGDSGHSEYIKPHSTKEMVEARRSGKIKLDEDLKSVVKTFHALYAKNNVVYVECPDFLEGATETHVYRFERKSPRVLIVQSWGLNNEWYVDDEPMECWLPKCDNVSFGSKFGYMIGWFAGRFDQVKFTVDEAEAMEWIKKNYGDAKCM